MNGGEGERQGGGVRVVIADDNAENLYLLEMMLKGSGLEPVSAQDGTEALDLLRGAGADLIISDILMPGMDGFQLCREVRADRNLRGIPFIFYTATYTSEQDEAFALRLGADRFVLKPAEPELLLAIIAEVLEKVRQRPVQPAPIDNGDYFAQYSARLQGKLEDKMEQVKQKERLYRNLFNSLRDVVIICGLDGAILDANQPALSSLFGYALEEVLGREAAIFPAGGTAALDAEAAFEGAVCDVTFRRKDGSVFTGEISTLGLRQDDGETIGNIHVIRDLSKQKMLEAQLLQAQKMEAIGRLAGGVAHDFNNKLTVLAGYIEILKRKKPPWEMAEEMLDQMLLAVRHSSDMTRQLLAFSRKQVISPRAVDLNALIESGYQGLGRLIGEDVRIGLSLAEDLWQTRLDPTQVEQILMNLAVNARDAMPRGGDLSFATRNVSVEEGGPGEDRKLPPGDYVQLEISDSGCGMEPEVLSHAFEPFFTTKEVGKGTGLGLATVYGIVTQNHGSIAVSSTPECGTSFTILFPRWSEEGAGEGAGAVASPAGAASGVILLVEDDDLVREVTIGMLQLLGYQVVEASGPEDAISICSRGQEIDLVLTDLVMPGMSGREMMKEIAAMRSGIRTLYMTGYSSDTTIVEGVIGGKLPLIRKPFQIDALGEKIASLLQP